MGSLLAAVAAVAAMFTSSGSAAAKPQTLINLPHAVAAFAQDGGDVAWFAPGGQKCNPVHLLALDNGLSLDLPAQKARNVTCRFNRSPRLPVGLAIAHGAGRALWTLPQESPLPLDYLLGASV